MQPNFPPTTKRIAKLTDKARAALEENHPKKRTLPEANGNTEDIQPKKAKKNLPHGNTLTNLSRRTAVDIAEDLEAEVQHAERPEPSNINKNPIEVDSADENEDDKLRTFKILKYRTSVK